MSITHPLYQWLVSNRPGEFQGFAEQIGLKSEKSLYRYFSHDRTPRKRVLQRIQEITNGQVTPNDFFSEAN